MLDVTHHKTCSIHPPIDFQIKFRPLDLKSLVSIDGGLNLGWRWWLDLH